MYEVEIKIELTEKERENLISLFKEMKFLSKGVTPQNDFYISAKKYQYGGYDLKRYRKEGNRFIYTEKIWEIVNGQPTRKENEHEVSEEEFESTIAKFPNTLKIIKDREWFDATYQETKISITIDTVKFDHSPNVRYFIEAEIGVKDKNDVSKTKDKIRTFLSEILKKTEIIEAPGMFTMAFEKK